MPTVVLEGKEYEIGARCPVKNRKWVVGMANFLPPERFLASKKLSRLAGCPEVRTILEENGAVFSAPSFGQDMPPRRERPPEDASEDAPQSEHEEEPAEAPA